MGDGVRARYTLELKQEAVRLVRGGEALASTARTLGVSAQSLDTRGESRAVIQHKITNGYRAMWAAQGEADIRTVVPTARLTPGTNIFGTIAATSAPKPP